MGKFTAIVIDFETTGLSPRMGDRTIEVGAVVVQDNRIVDRYQSLMNPGMRISSFIESYTGITNKMLASAPPVEQAIDELAGFIGEYPLIAHNASFDAKFLDAELSRINRTRSTPFVCSMCTARRIYQEAPSHSLEYLVRYKKLKTDGVHHRALADAEMTAHLWMGMITDVKANYGLAEVSYDLMQKLAHTPKKKVCELLGKSAGGSALDKW